MIKEETCYECKTLIKGEPSWGYGSDTMSLYDPSTFPRTLLGGHHGIEKAPKYEELYKKYTTCNPFLCRKCLAELWDTLVWEVNDKGSVMDNPYKVTTLCSYM